MTRRLAGPLLLCVLGACSDQGPTGGGTDTGPRRDRGAREASSGDVVRHPDAAPGRLDARPADAASDVRGAAMGPEPYQELDLEGYNHFGIVSQAGGRLHLFYRKGLNHRQGGTGVYRSSDDGGRSWSPAEVVLPSVDGDDVRVGSIGTAHDGALVVVFFRKQFATSQQNWFYVSLDPVTRRWSPEYLVEPPAAGQPVVPISQGQPYGRLLALADGRLLLTGYVHPPGDPEFYLQNWFGEREGDRMRWTRGAPVLSYPSTDGYLYAEHSVLPITATHWLAVSRGQHSLVFFKSTDGGASWSANGELVDRFYPNGAFGKLVSPMLDLIPGPVPRVLLTFADRATHESCYRVGRLVDHFLKDGEARGRVDWGPQHVYATNFAEGDLSGYPSGVFLGADPARYLLVDYEHRSPDPNQHPDQPESAFVRQFLIDLSVASLQSEAAIASAELDPPGRPAGLQVTPLPSVRSDAGVAVDTRRLSVKWDLPADEGARRELARYRVDVSSRPDLRPVAEGWWDRDVPLTEAWRAAGKVQKTVPGLLPGQTYHVRVRALDAAGNVSEPSVAVSAATAL